MAIFTIEELMKKHGVKPEDVKSIGAQQVNTANPVPSQESGFFSGIASDFKHRVNSAADSQVSALQGNQSDGSAALQTIGQGAGFVGDIATRTLGAVTPDFIKEALTAGVQKVAGTDTAQQVGQKYSEWKTQHPEAAANLEAVGNLSQIVPVGAVGAKGVQLGVKGALVGPGKALEATANVIGNTGKVIKGAGSVAYKSAITPTVKEAEQLLKYRADTPFLSRASDLSGTTFIPKSIVEKSKGPLTRGQTALEKGIAGTESMIGVQAKRLADHLWSNEIAPLVAKSDAVMTKDELFTPALERIASIEDPTRKAAMQNAYDSLVQDYQSYPDSFNLTKAQALKRDIAKFTPTKIFKGQDVASELRTLQADMASAIRTKTYQSLKDENIKKKYLDWANLDELQKVGVKAISDGSFKGGSGTLVSGLWDAATVPVKTVGGQVLYRVGRKLEFQAPKGINTLGQYLKTKGYTQPKQYDLSGMKGQVGLSIKSSVTPELVAKKIDVTDRNIITRFLDNPDDYALDNTTRRLFSEMGIDKTDQATQVRFLKEVLDASGL